MARIRRVPDPPVTFAMCPPTRDPKTLEAVAAIARAAGEVLRARENETQRRTSAMVDAASQAGLFSPEPPSEKQVAAAAALDALVAPKVARLRARSGKAPRTSRGSIERAREEAVAMAADADWSSARGTHLVALYEKLHEAVYGVLPAELDGKNWALASAAAGRLVEKDFGGDPSKAVAFMRWAWRREQGRERWRRENGRDGSRIGWRLQFGGSMLTEYRISVARNPGGAK